MTAPEITIRPEAPGDEAAIRAVTTQAFEQEAEGKIVDALRAAKLIPVGGSLVALDGNAVVGHLLLSWVVLRAEDETPDGHSALALGPMAVAPERQHQGIGSKLVQASIDVARNAEARVVIVLGHPEFYPRFGFTPARPQGIECPFPIESDAPWMALRLDDTDPAPSGTPDYPPAWEQE